MGTPKLSERLKKWKERLFPTPGFYETTAVEPRVLDELIAEAERLEQPSIVEGKGPYKVEEFKMQFRPHVYYRVVGPTLTGLHSTVTKYAADRHCNYLNAAWQAGRSVVPSQPTGELHKEVREALEEARKWLQSMYDAGGTALDTLCKHQPPGVFLTQFDRALSLLSAAPQGASPVTVEQRVNVLMEFLEDYIEGSITQMNEHSSDHGWQYDRGHRNWDKTMKELRADLTNLLKT